MKPEPMQWEASDYLSYGLAPKQYYKPGYITRKYGCTILILKVATDSWHPSQS
jgi:hypothetical protein